MNFPRSYAWLPPVYLKFGLRNAPNIYQVERTWKTRPFKQDVSACAEPPSALSC